MMTHVLVFCQVGERRGDEQAKIVAGAATIKSATSNKLSIEVAVEAVLSAVRADKDRLHILHKEKGGVNYNKSRLVSSFKEIMEDETIILSSPGVATMLISKIRLQLRCVWARWTKTILICK